jgi:hypothetical protein
MRGKFTRLAKDIQGLFFVVILGFANIVKGSVDTRRRGTSLK